MGPTLLLPPGLARAFPFFRDTVNAPCFGVRQVPEGIEVVAVLWAQPEGARQPGAGVKAVVGACETLGGTGQEGLESLSK